MWVHTRVLLSGVLLLSLPALAKNEKKQTLPASVVSAKTVFVMIDPDSGMSAKDPLANKTAQDDVEKAFLKWGRITPVMSGQTADIVVVLRKGMGRIADRTIAGGRINDRPGVVQATDNSVRIGAQQGQPPNPSSSPTAGPPDPQVHQQTEVGSPDDMFVVYVGGADVEQPLDHAPVWRSVRKNGLHSPDLPAFAEFRKAVEEAEKQQKKP